MAKQQGVYQRCTKACPARCKRHNFAFHVEFKPGPDGKRQRVTESGFPDANSAWERRQEVIREHQQGTLQMDRRRETVADYLNRWLESKESAQSIRPGTIRSYRGHITNYLVPAFGAVLLRDLRASHVDKMLVNIRKANADKPPNLQVSARSENLIHATLRSAVRDAIKAGQLTHDPTIAVHRSKASGKRRKVWTPEEFGRFRAWLQEPTDAAGHNSHAERLAPLVLFAVGTGMRLGEICGLRWSDIDTGAGYLAVNQQAQLRGRDVVFSEVKTSAGQGRSVPLGGWVPDMLRAVKAQQSRERLAAGTAWTNQQGLVFTDALGGPLRPGNVSKTFSRMGERAGLPRVVFHSLRHLAATIMLTNGLPLPVVSRILGHSTIQVTADLYFDLVKDDSLTDAVTAAYQRAFGA